MRVGSFAIGLAFLLAASCFAAGGPGLLDAIKRRDPKAVAALLQAKADVNEAQPDGATALSWAVHLDQTEIAEHLLAAGAKIDTADEYGETPLTLACSNGNTALVRRLLEIGSRCQRSALEWRDRDHDRGRKRKCGIRETAGRTRR